MIEKEEVFIVLTPGFAASEKDSTCLPMQQQFVQNLCLMHPEFKVVVLAFQYPYHQNQYQWHEATVIPFDGRNKGGWQRLMLRRKINSVLKKLHAEYRVRGLLSFWLGECALVGKKFGEKKGVRHCCWLWGQDAKASNKYARRVAPGANELIAFSDFLQDEFEKNHGTRPLYVIPPGIESGNANTTNRNIDMLGVGSLIGLKQFDIFIEILREITTVHPQVKAVLAGEGPERKVLQQLVTNYGLENNLELVGLISHEEVLNLMSRSKLLIHPSRYEGFSGVCLEALSRGAHVVSFCRAMKQEINHWHITNSREEMKNTALEILNWNQDYHPVIFRNQKKVVTEIMELYPLPAP